MVRRKKCDYDIDDSIDLFVGLSWPDIFLEDPAYALFRPLYERTSPWRSSYKSLLLYLNAQARRLGGRKLLLFYFSRLSMLTPAASYPHFKTFLAHPFEYKLILSSLFSEIELFLQWRFKEFSNNPWIDYPKPEEIEIEKAEITEKDLSPSVLSKKERKKILKKELSKIPWQTQLQKVLEYESGIDGLHTAIIENALKECPNLLTQKSNEDLVCQIFSSPSPALSLDIGGDGFVVAEIPVMLGSHYLGKKAQKAWFEAKGRKFYRILGCYARWDDAKVVIFKNKLHEDVEAQRQMFATIKEKLELKAVGNQIRAEVDGLDYYLSLLIDSDLPDRSFVISQWELNCPNLLILEKGY